MIAGFGAAAIAAGSGRPYGAARLTRYLWRMSLARLIAAMSFFLRPRARVQAVLPDVLVTTPVLVLPVLAVRLSMFGWLYRLKSGRSSTTRHTAGTTRGNVVSESPGIRMRDRSASVPLG